MKTATSFTTLFIAINMMSTITTQGLTIDLIRREFLQSPSLISWSHPFMTILRPSFNHHANTRISQMPLVDIFSDKGEYLMKLSIGKPPAETLAVVDTGSDLVWIQCKPCTECFLQKAPLFQPKLSSTYKPAACTSAPCNALHGRTSCLQDTCRYTIGYGDKSFSIGTLPQKL